MLTDVAGVRVGHWTDAHGMTGCTVVLLPEGTVASGEVRGGAPATREWMLLDPIRRVRRLDAVVLSGGSAFGLAAADGVMEFLDERGVGLPTRAGVVPIVVGMAIFDLAVGDPRARPGSLAGRAAAASAVAGPYGKGHVGAGTGARTGFDRQGPGGLGGATVRHGEVVVAALAVVNAAGYSAEDGDADLVELENVMALVEAGDSHVTAPLEGESTVIGVVVTNARIDKSGCMAVAQGAHDGLARAIDPPHTSVDGDAFVAAATSEVPASVDVVRALAIRAVHAAVLDGLRTIG